VFFDLLGIPWPVHDCDRTWAQGIARSTAPDGAITAQLNSHVSVTRPLEGFSVEEAVLERFRTKARQSKPDPIIAVAATQGASLTIVARLREIAREANPLKATRAPDTKIARAFLGPIGSQPVGRITVHQGSLATSQLRSFTAWIPRELLADPRLLIDVLLEVALDGVQIESHGCLWFGKSLRILR
jgi:hypothetical protein